MAATAYADTNVATLEADSAELTSDSGLGSESDNESIRSASITSSITGYKYENGRRYHAYREGAYFLPNDDAEQERLDLTHHICRLLLDGNLYVAPIKKDLKRCLDLGTDLSPIQPTWIPPNLRFLVDDMESPWDYRQSEAFDYIHQRSLGGSIKDWPALFQQIYQNLKPSAWTEMQEYEGLVRSIAAIENAPNVKALISLVNEAAEKIGRKINVAPEFKEMMEAAGFADVVQHAIQVVIGTWAKGTKWKEIGLCQREQFIDGMDVYAVGLLTRVLGWQLDEVQVLLAKANAEIRDPKKQLYICFHYVYGRKSNASN